MRSARKARSASSSPFACPALNIRQHGESAMRHPAAVLFALLCVLPLGGCAGGNTGIALGYGHHGPGIAVFTDNLWYTPHQAGVSVPLGWESGSYTHAPAGPSGSGVSATVPIPSGQAGPVTGYVEPPRAALAASGASAGAPDGTPGGPAGTGAASPSASPAASGPAAPASRLGETPAVLEPPDLSY